MSIVNENRKGRTKPERYIKRTDGQKFRRKGHLPVGLKQQHRANKASKPLSKQQLRRACARAPAHAISSLAHPFVLVDPMCQGLTTGF